MNQPHMTNYKTTMYKVILPDLEEYLKSKQSTESAASSQGQFNSHAKSKKQGTLFVQKMFNMCTCALFVIFILHNNLQVRKDLTLTSFLLCQVPSCPLMEKSFHFIVTLLHIGIVKLFKIYFDYMLNL